MSLISVSKPRQPGECSLKFVRGGQNNYTSTATPRFNGSFLLCPKSIEIESLLLNMRSSDNLHAEPKPRAACVLKRPEEKGDLECLVS